MSRFTLISGLAALAALTIAAPAAATTRVASPGGSGTACDPANPCNILTAFAQAGDGDELVLQPGEYGTPTSPIPTDIEEGDDIDFHGVEGQPRPVITSSATVPLLFFGAGATARHFEINGLDPGNIGALAFQGKLVEDFKATGGGLGGQGCDFEKTPLVRNGLCVGTDYGVLLSGVGGAGIHPTLRNVTMSGGEHGLSIQSTTGRPTAATVVNSILLGGTADVELFAFQTNASVNVTRSNLTLPPDIDETPPGVAVFNDGGGNQSAPPLLSGDFHQLTGSPTIDAGIPSPDNGAKDFDGEGREQGSAPDIGADEVDVPLAFDLTAKRRQVAKRLKASLSCSATCATQLTGKGRADGRGFSSRFLEEGADGGAAESVRIGFRKRTLRRIRDEKARLTLTAEATDLAGHTVTDEVVVRLRPER